MHMKQAFTALLDCFYPPFRKFMPLLTYRYAACGGINTVLGLLVYYISFHRIFDKHIVDLGYLVFKPHVAALLLSGFFSFLFGFLLNKFIVFTDSELKGRVQLFRYAISFGFNITLNYFMLRALVELAGFDAFVSQLLTTSVVVAVGYLTQKYFTFKVS